MIWWRPDSSEHFRLVSVQRHLCTFQLLKRSEERVGRELNWKKLALFRAGAWSGRKRVCKCCEKLSACKKHLMMQGRKIVRQCRFFSLLLSLFVRKATLGVGGEVVYFFNEFECCFKDWSCRCWAQTRNFVWSSTTWSNPSTFGTC